MTLSIFPCRDKRPLTSKGLYDARPQDEWSGEESDQWGAPCGAINGFFVIDVDKKSGGLETAAQFDWGTTLRLNTPGGGYHVFYRFDENCGDIRNGVSVLPGVDVRSTGGYVILYGEVDSTQILPAPPWLLALVNKPKARSAVLDQHGEVGEGGRNHFLTAAAGRMQRLGVLSMAALNELNEAKCAPPLEENEVSTIYESVSRYAPESSPEDDPEPPKKIVWAGELVQGFLEYLRDKGRVAGDPTGIEEFDDLLGGGKRLGELTVTLAEAKSGKNTFWHYLQRIQLDKGIQIGYASRELSPETEVLPNLLTLALDKNVYKSAEVTEEELVKAMRSWKLAFAPGYGSFQGNELFDWMDECRLHGISYFYIDHLHYCLANSEDFKEVAELARKLKSYTKTHAVHIDLIIQPKSVDMTFIQELDIQHIRGGASLGQVLDNLITMQRQRDENGELIDVTKVTLKRARSKLAKPGSFYLAYNRDMMTFAVVEKESAKEESAPPVVMPKAYDDDIPVADRGRGSPFARPHVEPRRPSAPVQRNSIEAAADSMIKRIRLKGSV